MVKVAVWKIGDWKKSKYPSRKDNKFYDNKVVIFKGIGDDNKDIEYHLNLNKEQPGVVEDWNRVLILGARLEVTLMPKGGIVKNDTTINKFGQFRVV